MFQEEFAVMVGAAKAKAKFLEGNPLGYFVASMLAGMYVGFGIFLIFSIGGMLQGSPYTKLVMGLTFGIALSLVVMAGAELFTGNNMVMIAGWQERSVSVGQIAGIWIVCLLGNWLGAVTVAVLFWQAGLATGAIGEFIAITSATKMALPFWELFFRGVLCNTLVCAAIWCNFRVKSDSGKLIMIFWCLFAFITTGFEHSIANMSLLTVSLLASFGADVSLLGYFYNLSVVALGNMVGGIFLIGLPYYLIARK